MTVYLYAGEFTAAMGPSGSRSTPRRAARQSSGYAAGRLKDKDLTQLSIPLSNLVIFLGISVLVGVVAAIIPAVRAARTKVVEAIATE